MFLLPVFSILNSTLRIIPPSVSSIPAIGFSAKEIFLCVLGADSKPKDRVRNLLIWPSLLTINSNGCVQNELEQNQAARASGE
ncbi:MAG: hypothetical protein KJZ86_27375, partial [Caldilineaceae bacterium]|nr:hypothetical protein [Caldilineaceae bacterium]